MKNKNLTLGLLLIALLILAVLFGKPYHPGKIVPEVSAEQGYAPEVLSIKDRIYSKNQEYGAITKRQKELQKEIDTLQSEKSDLAIAADGYDRILCAEHKLTFSRPTAIALSGSLLDGCSFQR